MTSWLISGGIVVTLVLGMWLQRQEIQGLEDEVSELNASLMMKDAALTQNKTALGQCEDTNAANEAEAQRQREAARRASDNVAALRDELSAALADVSHGTESFTDAILNTPYPADFVGWLRDD